MRVISRTWSDEALTSAVSVSSSWTQVLRRLGLVPAGGNYESIRNHVNRLSIDTSHFRPHGGSGDFLTEWNIRRRLTEDEIFCEHSRIRSGKVAKHIRRYQLMPYVCEGCDNKGQHNGKPLTLQLDHRNGVGNDNRKENLRWMCPNCHSQTPTFAGRSTRKRKGSPSVVRKVRQTQQKVAYATLASRYRELQSYVAVAREFGVSDVTVRNAVNSRIV